MAESDPLQILLLHDRWATAQMFEACGRLTGEQFYQRFEIGPGSLHDTLTHVVGAMRTWTETLAGWEARPRLEEDGERRTAGELLALFEESWVAFSAEARRGAVGEMVTRTMRSGRTLQFTRGAVVAQVTTHGVHHRAQCLNMLRQLGVTPLPGSSVAEWTWLGEGRG
ncbi:MAG: DinB family protein [Phycisphaerales bacterium]|nr:DinB family protein [Phycisphaerales bacterium]